ncbi:DUF1824 family protein [Thermocoleostomius sinensis]|uniref:DUF1824 family protein n=1 Tax=Thermocoleostomius sinensis A174 TaxID=2016057 RepID=A0A9E9CC86_9CYAN|nr:DUF1824 family protein [Thermocoleostomius sinensis]WAL62270.1 DUF1824 family protein [Thermocoleostomius sinensis A174]
MNKTSHKPSHYSQSIEEARQLLRQFDCLNSGLPSTTPASIDRQQLRQALLQVACQSEYQLLGICANNFAEAQQALVSYATALGYVLNAELVAIDGPVYIKFNPKSGGCYVAPYVGSHRGVLVSCQSAYETDLNEMYGHLPLDLFLD